MSDKQAQTAADAPADTGGDEAAAQAETVATTFDTGVALHAGLVERGLLGADAVEGIDVVAAALGAIDDGAAAQAALADAGSALAAMTAERDALQAAANKAASAAKATKRKASSVRKVGPITSGKDYAVERDAAALLERIQDAETVELVFSDGRREIEGLPALVVTGQAWAVVQAGLQLRLPSLLVEGPGPGDRPYEIAGYGLMLDGDQVAWRDRPDVLRVGPGQRVDLTGDVIF